MLGIFLKMFLFLYFLSIGAQSTRTIHSTLNSENEKRRFSTGLHWELEFAPLPSFLFFWAVFSASVASDFYFPVTFLKRNNDFFYYLFCLHKKHCDQLYTSSKELFKTNTPYMVIFMFLYLNTILFSFFAVFVSVTFSYW